MFAPVSMKLIPLWYIDKEGFMSTGITAINEKVKNESAFVSTLKSEVKRVIVGQDYMIERLLIVLFNSPET